jgi:NDP-sugar pyrophosphorylase family protein
MIKGMESIIIHRSNTIKEAMKQLEENGRRILFVVDDAKRLVGAVVDGDIRRWILTEGSVNDPVERVCNKNPFLVHEAYSINEVREVMLEKRISCIPVVNAKREIIELIFWDDIFEEGIVRKPLRKLDLPVVIMAGGKGTRMDPFTQVLPKPLIPIGDKTVIELIIDSFLEYGLRLFYISVNYKSKIIKSYFEELDPGYRIEYIEEEQPLGTAGSLKYLKNKIDGSLLVTNCDIIIKADYADLVDFHCKAGNMITIVASMKSYHIPYGICEIENGGCLTKMVEKPEYSFLVNTGMYVLHSDTLGLIPQDEVFQITDLIEKVKEQNGKVGVFPVSDNAWLDIGEWTEYKKALKKFDF